jgi:hypothetical protein
MVANSTLILGAGELDCVAFVGGPAILMRDDCTVRGLGPSSKIKEVSRASDGVRDLPSDLRTI